MIQVHTRNFGDIEIAEEKVLCFPHALPGFPELKKFALIADPAELAEESAVFYWLQSLEDTDIAFCLVDLSKIMTGYDPLVDKSDIAGLGLEDGIEDLLIYNMVVVPENPRDATVNMKAPIVINPYSNQGVQVICQNEEYAIRHRLLNNTTNRAGS
jgi:flagellar assembly factor FliW